MLSSAFPWKLGALQREKRWKWAVRKSSLGVCGDQGAALCGEISGVGAYTQQCIWMYL